MRLMISALLLAATPAFAAKAPVGPKWSIEKKSDPITDSGQVILMLEQDPIFLRFDCEKRNEGPYAGMVGTTSYVGSRPVIRSVTIRFDQNKPYQSMWLHSNHYAIMNGGEAGMLAALARSRTLAVRLTNGDGANIDLVFNVTGAAAQVAKFKDACRAIGFG